MTIMFDDQKLRTIEDLQTFLAGTDSVQFHACTKREKAVWIRSTLARFKFSRLQKPKKSIVKNYIQKVTGYSRAQVTRHIAAYRKNKPICTQYKRNSFPSTYTDADRELLAGMDNLHSPPDRRTSASAIQHICARAYALGDKRFERLAHISVAHIYNLRSTKRYKQFSITVECTKTVDRTIGERRKPDPKGRPGFLRVDTVHQGDFNGQKGVYHINLVDEVLQWQVIISVEQISEKFLKPILEKGLSLFPFLIRGFHSDNGSEYINDCVSRILKKLTIKQTKGRSRHCNDNALVEGKNASTVRKWWGHAHIHRSFAARLNIVNMQYLVPYLNFHHPCAFAVEKKEKNGKIKKKYPHDQYKTPFEKLCSLKNPKQYLRPGVTMAMLQELSQEKSPNEAAKEFQEARHKVLKIALDSSATLSLSCNPEGST